MTTVIYSDFQIVIAPQPPSLSSRVSLQAVGSGLSTLPILISRASARIRYRTLCIPDDVSDRGVDRLPHSYYAQDALRIWDALHR